MKPNIILTVVLAVVFANVANVASAGLKIYYIRHAEGGHNVKRAWKASGIPESEWPAFVGDHEQFSPKGELQRMKAIETLGEYEKEFDLIAVSPAWRAKYTVLPYLKDTQTKGEIWPELKEIGASSLILSSELAAPAYGILDEGDPIKLTAEETPYFSLRADGKNEFRVRESRDEAKKKQDRAAAHRLIIQSVIDRVKKNFGGTNKMVLLVGHKGSGTGILRMLLNDRLQEFPSLLNTGVWMVEEQADGSFKLRVFNDVPLQHATKALEDTKKVDSEANAEKSKRSRQREK